MVRGARPCGPTVQSPPPPPPAWMDDALPAWHGMESRTPRRGLGLGLVSHLDAGAHGARVAEGAVVLRRRGTYGLVGPSLTVRPSVN